MTIAGGTSGVLYHDILYQYPWKDYNSQITSAAFSGSIRLGMDMFGEVIDGNALGMFQGCTNLTSVSGMSSLHGVVKAQSMFGSCSSLTTLDLTGFDVTNAQARFMFSGCNALSTVTFGSAFSIANEGYTTDFVEPGKACTNTANGIVATTDDAFRALTAAERAGTWTRGVDASFKVTAQRSTGGVADEDGEDVTFSITWATDATTTARTLTIYQKSASSSSYPSTPAYTATLTGDSGTVAPTLSNVGDDAYDFKVEFYDGTNTFIAYPSVQSNIRLLALDEQEALFLGELSAKGRFIGPMAYGSYYGYTDLTLTTAFQNLALSTFSGDGVTKSGDGVKIDKAGVYLVLGSCYFFTGYTANDIVHLAIYQNSNAVCDVLSRMYSANPYQTMQASAILTCSAGDVIKLSARNQTGARGTVANRDNHGLTVVQIA